MTALHRERRRSRAISLRGPYGDPRLDGVIAETVADDVAVAFAIISRAKSPAANYRWSLHADGRLFWAEHSGSRSDPQVPFDKEFAKKPRATLSAAQIASVQAALKTHKFFDHPGNETWDARGGSYYVVRARHQGKLHSVVFDAVRTPLVEFLWNIPGNL